MRLEASDSKHCRSGTERRPETFVGALMYIDCRNNGCVFRIVWL